MVSFDGIVIYTPADLQRLERYRNDFIPEETRIRAPIKRYSFKSLYQCGNRHCHQWHMEGWAVELEDGTRSNIGHICMEHYDGDFNRKVSIFQEQSLAPEYRRRIAAAKHEMREQQPEIDELVEVGMRMAAAKRAVRLRFPGLHSELLKRATQNDVELMRSRRRSHEEIADLVAASPGSTRERWTWEQQPLGTLRGLDAFTVNLHQALVETLQQPLAALLAFDEANAPYSRLEEHMRIVDTLPASLDTTQRAVAASGRFFQAENLKRLKYLDLPREEARAIGAGLTLESLLREENRAAAPAISGGRAGSQKLPRKARRALAYDR